MSEILADMVVLVHLMWILFLVFGAWAGRRRCWVRWLHLGGLAVSLLLTAAGWICPLTHVESWLRGRGQDGGGGYPGTFVGYYAGRLVYLDVSRWVVLVAVLVIAALSAWIYARAGHGAGTRPEARP